MEEAVILWQGQHWTSVEWYQYQEALARSETQWEQSTKEFLDRHPIPEPKIIGKR